MHLYAEVENNRLVTVLQENTVLRSEVEVLRLKCKHLIEENRRLRQASVTIVSPCCSIVHTALRTVSIIGSAIYRFLIIVLTKQFLGGP